MQFKEPTCPVKPVYAFVCTQYFHSFRTLTAGHADYKLHAWWGSGIRELYADCHIGLELADFHRTWSIMQVSFWPSVWVHGMHVCGLPCCLGMANATELCNTDPDHHLLEGLLQR